MSLKDSTPPRLVPDLWYQVRKKIGDIAPALPQGAGPPLFNDEFGDLFGIVYAFTGDGFTLPELRHVVEDTRQALLSIPSIAKVDLLGVQTEQINVEFSYRALARYGLSAQDIFAAIRRENAVVGGGSVDTSVDRVFVRTGAGIDGLAMLRDLPVQAQRPPDPAASSSPIFRGQPPIRPCSPCNSTAARRSASPSPWSRAATSWTWTATSRRG